MVLEFQAQRDPSDELCREIAAHAPGNPFFTGEYIRAKQLAGLRPYALVLRDNGRIVAACPAFERSRFLLRSLEIESLPALTSSDTVFWDELRRFCRAAGISELEVHSAASKDVVIPPLTGEIWRRTRSEFVIELRGRDLWKELRATHRQRVNRSRKNDVALRVAQGNQAWQEHAAAVSASMQRRRSRGEHVAEIHRSAFFEALLLNGRAELFQAAIDDRVLSSALVISADKGAYYFWAGTREEGMALGASHFLIHSISVRLQEQGLDTFNLGGTDLANKGLVEFKRGFGTTEIPLESAGCRLGSQVKRAVGRSVALLKDDPTRLVRMVMDRVAPRPAVAPAPED